MKKLTTLCMNLKSDAMTVQTECNQSSLQIAEVQPVLARAKLRRKTSHCKYYRLFSFNLQRQLPRKATIRPNPFKICRLTLLFISILLLLISDTFLLFYLEVSEFIRIFALEFILLTLNPNYYERITKHSRSHLCHPRLPCDARFRSRKTLCI